MDDPQRPNKYNAFNQTYEADHVSKIPLPTDAPLNTRSKNLAAVDQLVNQNQDLMSRLGIALRRVGILEEDLRSFKENHDLLSKEVENSHDEIERLKLSEERLILTIANLKKNRSEAEKQFAELYTECLNLKNQNSDLFTQLSRYKRYQKRIKENVRPYLNQIKTEVSKLKEEYASTTAQKSRLDIKLNEVQRNLKDSINYIQTQSEEFKNHQNQLIDIHEQASQKLKEENKSLTHSYEEIKNKNTELSSKLERLQEKNIILENKTIVTERAFKEAKEKHLEKEKEFKNAISKLKIEKQKIKTNTELSKESLQSYVKELKEKEEECDELKKQLEGQKTLFNETIKKLDKITEKESALQRLNRELTLSLQKQRTELQEYASHNKELQKDTSKKVDALCSILETTAREEGAKNTAIGTSKEKLKFYPQYNRIEKLLTEIESGFINNKDIK